MTFICSLDRSTASREPLPKHRGTKGFWISSNSALGRQSQVTDRGSSGGSAVGSRRVQSFNRKRLADALVQALEAIVCTFGLMWLFAAAHQPGAIWALVSAVIVLRPGFEDSLHASKVRIAANVVGALVGVSVGTIR